VATYVNNLRLKEIATGDESGTWGVSTNTNLELIADSLGYGTQDCFSTDANSTTTVPDGSADPSRAMYFKVTSSATLTTTRVLTIAPNTISRLMWIENATTGSQSIDISQGSGANVTIESGATKIIYLDGAGAGAAVIDAMGNYTPTTTDTLAEVLALGNTSGATNLIIDSGQVITTNTISETTAASGVTIDSVLLKDNTVLAGTALLGAGSLTDSSGAISFGNENLTTTGTLASGALTVTGTGSTTGNFTVGATGSAGSTILAIKGATGGALDWYAGATRQWEIYNTSGILQVYDIVTNAARADFTTTGFDLYGDLTVTGEGSFTNAGTGNGVFIDQNGNGVALNIDSEATTAAGMVISADAATSSNILFSDTSSASFSGNVIYARINHASATGYGIRVANEGTGNGVFIDQNGNGVALNIDSQATTTVGMVLNAPTTNYLAQFQNSHASAPTGIQVEFGSASPDDTIQQFIYLNDATTARAVCYSNGNWYNHDGVYGTISDAKLKTDIQDARSYWDDFKALQYRKYKMKADIEKYGDETGYRLGLVAQEAELVFPGCVKETPDMEEVVVDTIERPVMEDVVIPAEFDEEGNEVSPERTEQKAKKDEDGNDVVETEEVKESKQKVDADGNLEVTKVVKSSIIEGPILAKVLQEAMERIEALEAEIAALKSA
jgi:hypothetical protein